MVGEAVFVKLPEQRGVSACFKYERVREKRQQKQPKNMKLALRRAKERYYMSLIEDGLLEVEFKKEKAREKSERLRRLWHE